MINPMFFLTKDYDYLTQTFKDVNSDIKKLNGKIAGKEKKKKKSKQGKALIEKSKQERVLLVIYRDTLGDIIKAKEKYKSCSGIMTNQLIDRLKLLGGSVMAGNNGIVPEFTQIANYLNSIKVLPTAELKKMIAAMKIYLGNK